jgi:hypothetical protein
VLLLVLAGVGAYLVFGSGDEIEKQPAAAPEDLHVPWVDSQGQSPIVGSVDLNPADDSLWLSTNTGLWRVAADTDRPKQVTGRLTTGQRSPASERTTSMPSSSRATASSPASSAQPPST